MSNYYVMCERCVMDTTAVDINFDENGYCNYCSEFLELIKIPKEKFLPFEGNLEKLVEAVKLTGRGKEYDCIVGVSGGVDSSYTLVKVRELGLRPLAVHMNNGWNSEEAENNIRNLVENLGVDLYTYVIDWEEYKQLQEAFFAADVVDIELLYDNALKGVCYGQANKYNVNFILAGTNIATEGLKLPGNWVWYKHDRVNIESIAKWYGVKIRTFPAFGTSDFKYFTEKRKIFWISFLDYLPEYNKEEALRILEKNYDYERYPYKHYESVFTRFYQGYILPKKFNIDKRKVHFSNLIMSGQMTREEALGDLKKIPYPSEEKMQEDIEYFLKKMGWSMEKLEAYLRRPRKEHYYYGTEVKIMSK